MRPVVVAKVGGSLFDLPDLRDRLLRWISGVEAERILLVPGGGEAADVIRRLDQVHRLGEETAHWLAIRMLAVNGRVLAALLGVPVTSGVRQLGPAPAAVVDAYVFCREDDGEPGAVEHSWRVTSDSITARIAAVAGGQLVLLKSIDLPDGCTWEGASSGGLVDEAFPEIVRRHELPVTWVNLRRPQHNSCE